MQSGIIADLKASYGLTCRDITPVTGGWLNEKWEVITDVGALLVKQFSAKRYRTERFAALEAALQRQLALERLGVPCPRIRPCAGHAIRMLADGTAYTVMAFCPGHIEGPCTITHAQMRSLGDACARMHCAFAQLPTLAVEGYPIRNEQVPDALWVNFHARAQESAPGAPAVYHEAVLAQEPILRALTNTFFEKLPQGIAHEDFAADNILFDGGHVSAIVDFDRCHYSYVWHDIGRVLLSFALRDGRMAVDKIRAFIAGYEHHAPLTMPNIVDALRLTWCIETPWWIQPACFQESSEKVIRFKDELLWLTAHWFELDALLGG